MDEARNLLREAKRRRQFTQPQSIIRSALRKCGKEAVKKKQLRFAEELNQVHEIPILDSPPNRTVIAVPGAEIDWVYEATKAVNASAPHIDETLEITPPQQLLEELNSENAEPPTSPAAHYIAESVPVRAVDTDSNPPPPSPPPPSPPPPAPPPPTPSSVAGLRLAVERVLGNEAMSPKGLKITAAPEGALESMLWEEDN